jgi:hypothetical protein
MNRVLLTKIHMLLAAFMFPVALMFLITGGFYTWGVSGSYDSQSYDVALAQPLTADQELLLELTLAELQRLAVPLPSGAAKVKRTGTSFQLEWTGSKRDVILEPVSDPLVARLVVKNTTWYRNLVQLHKAKGGVFFKIYAAMLAVALFTILFSGFLMAWQVPKYRRQALVFAGAGAGLFVAMVAMS